MGCRYRLKGLAANRCPECGRAFDPNDETTFDGASRDFTRSRLPRPVRAAIVLGGLGLWYLATMCHASANTSWESHRYAGPFMIIKESLRESHGASDWAIALLVWAFFVSFPLHWIITGRWWSAIVTLMLCGLAIFLSDFAAMAASC